MRSRRPPSFRKSRSSRWSWWSKQVAGHFDQVDDDVRANGRVGVFNFGLLGSAAGLAAFEDVLLAGTGRLHHLVVGARAFVYETVTEMERGLINDERFLTGKKFLVAAMGWDEAGAIALWSGRKVP